MNHVFSPGGPEWLWLNALAARTETPADGYKRIFDGMTNVLRTAPDNRVMIHAPSLDDWMQRRPIGGWEERPHVGPEWMKCEQFELATGYSRAVVYLRCKQFVWPEGTIWRIAPDGNRLIHWPNFDRWVMGLLRL